MLRGGGSREGAVLGEDRSISDSLFRCQALTALCWEEIEPLLTALRVFAHQLCSTCCQGTDVMSG